MSVFEWWRDRRDRIAAEQDEPIQFDRAEDDPVVARFQDAKRALVDLIPAAPLCSPALRHWKEIEAGLCSDPQFIPGVDAALRDSKHT